MPYFIALVAGLLLTAACLRGLDGRERKFVLLCYVAHLLASGALLWLHYAQGSDMEGYEIDGIAMANLMRLDFARYFPEVLKIILKLPTSTPISYEATATMDALSSLCFLVIGDSLPAVCVFVGSLVMVGQVSLYKVAREYLDSDSRKYAAIGCMLVPSVVFWTSGLVKEAWSVAGIGFLLRGIHSVAARRRFSGAVGAVIGAVLVAAVKPYTLFPVVLLVTAWIYSARTGGKIRLSYAIVAALIGIGGILLMGKLFPEFAVEKLGESLSRQQYYSKLAGGGSFTEMDAADVARLEARDMSLAGQLKHLPLALLNTLFRPMVFEARSVPQLAAALESTLFVVAAIDLLRRGKVRTVAKTVASSPLLFGSFIFMLAFAMSVGLASQNLGTLSRYRVPMMPMYVSLMLVVRQRTKGTVPVPAAPAAPRGALVPARRAARFATREQALRAARLRRP